MCRFADWRQQCQCSAPGLENALGAGQRLVTPAIHERQARHVDNDRQLIPVDTGACDALARLQVQFSSGANGPAARLDVHRDSELLFTVGRC